MTFCLVVLFVLVKLLLRGCEEGVKVFPRTL